MDIISNIFQAWPLILVAVLAFVFIRLGRGPRTPGDPPRDSTGGYGD